MNAATAATWGGWPAREAQILKWVESRNPAGTVLGYFDCKLPSGMIVFKLKLMRGPKGALWIGLPNQIRRDRDDQVVLDPNGKLIWDPTIDFDHREDRDRFSRIVLTALRQAHPELWETEQ